MGIETGWLAPTYGSKYGSYPPLNWSTPPGGANFNPGQEVKSAWELFKSLCNEVGFSTESWVLTMVKDECVPNSPQGWKISTNGYLPINLGVSDSHALTKLADYSAALKSVNLLVKNLEASVLVKPPAAPTKAKNTCKNPACSICHPKKKDVVPVDPYGDFDGDFDGDFYDDDSYE